MAMNDILTLETKKYNIKLENFEGPLDLLCHLVDKNKMEIDKVNITQITDQYIEYLKMCIRDRHLILAMILNHN